MKRSNSKDVSKPYEPTPRESEALEAYVARKQAKPPAPPMKISEKDGTHLVSFDHPDSRIASPLLMQAVGTIDPSFFDGLLSQLANAGIQGRNPDARGLNFMLSVVKGIEPKDQVEAMLAAQMAAVHMATMTFARRLAHVENIPQQDSAERAFNKLARTFAAQVEALKRYRTGGEQTVRVEHVTVNAGGQAIVGSVNRGAGTFGNQEGQPHAKQIGDAPGEALPSTIAALRDVMPCAGGARESGLSDARRRTRERRSRRKL